MGNGAVPQNHVKENNFMECLIIFGIACIVGVLV